MWPLSHLTHDRKQPKDVTLWLSLADTTLDQHSFLTQLSDAERQRFDDMTLPRRRAEFATARALQRFALAEATGIAPDRLSFTKGAHGKPAHASVEFNITHCRGLVACAVSHQHPVGLDAEPLSRGDQVIEVMKRVFTAFECARLNELELAQKQRAAIELWTLKEAVMKECGKGMSLEPASFSVDVKEDRLALQNPRLNLSLYHLGQAHSLAICTKANAPLNIETRWFKTPFDLNS